MCCLTMHKFFDTRLKTRQVERWNKFETLAKSVLICVAFGGWKCIGHALWHKRWQDEKKHKTKKLENGAQEGTDCFECKYSMWINYEQLSFFFFLQLLSSLFVQDDSFSKIVILNKKLFLGHISNPFISLYIFVILETVKMCKSGTDVTHQSFHFSFAVFFHNVQGCF